MLPRVRKRHVLHVGPNMTPMVDIAMCILIFFMLGSTFAIQELYLTNVPAIDKKGLGSEQADAKLPAVRQLIELKRVGDSTKVLAFGRMLEGIDDLHPPEQTTSKLREIQAFLEDRHDQLSEDTQIILVPERDVPWQDVTTLYDLCMKAQFKNVAFASPR